MTRLIRVFGSASLGIGLALLAFQTGGPIVAQEKAKEKPKTKPERIAISDPGKMTDDKDYAIQGEYEGKKGDQTIGLQVVAKGENKFLVKQLTGGLPGAGWDGKTETLFNTKFNSENNSLIAEGFQAVLGVGKLTLVNTDKSESSVKKISRTSPTLGAKPPEGAKVLFAQPGDETQWINGKIIELADGKFLNPGITSKQAFGNFKAHIEFRMPWMPNSSGQGRGNSGFYLQNRYELQILDSFGLKGENNECGGIYTLHKPLVNMCLPPMVWQTYDIDFTAAKFEGDKKTANAKVTILHNGVKIHDNAELTKSTGGGQPEKATPGPIQLQNHNDPVVFRNVWVLEVK